MADFTEPKIVEDYKTLTGTATWKFDINRGYEHDNTVLTSYSIVLEDSLKDGECTFPLFIPPTFASWISAVQTGTGLYFLDASTSHQPTFQTVTDDMSTISERGDKITFKVSLLAGANTFDSLVVKYNMSFASVSDINEFANINADVEDPDVFDNDSIRSAIRYANAKVLYILKDWSTFYTDRIDTYIRRMLVQAEVYYALALLYDRKGKDYLNKMASDGFSVGDLSVTPDAGGKREFVAVYDTISQICTRKGDTIMMAVMPPGTESARTIFYWGTSKSIETVDKEKLLDIIEDEAVVLSQHIGSLHVINSLEVGGNLSVEKGFKILTDGQNGNTYMTKNPITGDVKFYRDGKEVLRLDA